MWYFQSNTYESCTTTCGNVGLTCNPTLGLPTSDEQMQALAVSLGQYCTTFYNYYPNRPMISSTGGCYYNAANTYAFDCATATWNGWRGACRCVPTNLCFHWGALS